MKINIKESERQIIAIMAVLFLVAVFYIQSINKEIVLGAAKEVEIAAYEESIKPFLNLALEAKAFAIYDADQNNFVYKKNAEAVMPLASLAKVMSAIVVLEHAPADKIFEISKESLDQEADHGLLLGEKWHRDELLKFALFVSSNDAIHELALETGRIIDPASTDPIKTFVDELNSRAQDFGFKSFQFNNESGLDISDTENGAYANARDMAKLFGFAVKTYPEIFGATTTKIASISSLDKMHNIDNTNTIVENIPAILGSKTGFTAISGGNLVVATSPESGKTRVVVVMGSTYDARFTDMRTLTGAVVESLK
jgi:D-alanyl-D-alanine carboxypeptidase